MKLGTCDLYFKPLDVPESAPFKFLGKIYNVEIELERVREFAARTELPEDEVTIVQLPSGRRYPQWLGAVEAIKVIRIRSLP